MRTRILSRSLPATLVALSASLVLASAALAAETTLTTTLAGSAATDADGSGTASVVLDPAAGSACWDITTASIDAATLSHIHEGAVGVDGGVVVPLDVDGFDGSTEGCVQAQDAAVLQGIIDNPAGFYVNVHNAAYPGGAIRGQLSAQAPNTAMLDAATPPFVLIGGLLVLIALGLARRAAAATIRSR